MGEQPNQRRWNDTISELPAFYGNDKDTLSAESLVHRVEAAATALGWDDEATFNNFSLCLRADAERWLALTRDIGLAFEGTWSYIKPRFRKEYGTKMNETKVFKTMKDMSMKHSETPTQYMVRINDQWKMISELCKHQVINVPAVEADRTVAVCQNLYKQGFNDAIKEVQRLFFISGLPENLLEKVAQKENPTLYDVLENTNKLNDISAKKDVAHNGIHQVDQAEDTDAEFVNKIQQSSNRGRGNYNNSYRGRSNSRPNNGSNYSSNNGNYGNNSNNGNNSSSSTYRGRPQSSRGSYSGSNASNGQRNTQITCVYCKIQGHHQDDCRKRIRDNKPCISGGGKPYWPRSKVNKVDEDEQGEEPQVQSAMREKKHLFQ